MGEESLGDSGDTFIDGYVVIQITNVAGEKHSVGFENHIVHQGDEMVGIAQKTGSRLGNRSEEVFDESGTSS